MVVKLRLTKKQIKKHWKVIDRLLRAGITIQREVAR